MDEYLNLHIQILLEPPSCWMGVGRHSNQWVEKWDHSHPGDCVLQMAHMLGHKEHERQIHDNELEEFLVAEDPYSK